MNYKQLILPINFTIFYRRSAAMFKFLNPDLSGKTALLLNKSKILTGQVFNNILKIKTTS
ncbi:MAG TPA: hypothetical protein DCS93_26705 [Microscillaceae bacterium]|nr:hypothetical protein [Microscillaceae bacterium]